MKWITISIMECKSKRSLCRKKNIYIEKLTYVCHVPWCESWAGHELYWEWDRHRMTCFAVRSWYRYGRLQSNDVLGLSLPVNGWWDMMKRLKKRSERRTHVVRKFGHEEFLENGWELIFQTSPGLVTRYKVSVASGGAVQLLVKSIAGSEPQWITEEKEEEGTKAIQNGFYERYVTSIKRGSSWLRRWSTYFNIGSVCNFSRTDVYGMPRTWSMMWTKPFVAAMSDWTIVAFTPPPSTVIVLLLSSRLTTLK